MFNGWFLYPICIWNYVFKRAKLIKQQSSRFRTDFVCSLNIIWSITRQWLEISILKRCNVKFVFYVFGRAYSGFITTISEHRHFICYKLKEVAIKWWNNNFIFFPISQSISCNQIIGFTSNRFGVLYTEIIECRIYIRQLRKRCFFLRCFAIIHSVCFIFRIESWTFVFVFAIK